MSKIDWEHLKLIEEWSDENSTPDNAYQKEEKRLQTLSSLILKIYRQQKISEWKKSQKENEKIRRKVGIES